MPAGRPTKYKKEYCRRIVDAMSQGKSVLQFCAEQGVSKSSVYLWAQQHNEFSDALSRGKELGEAYWEGELQKMMYSREANAPLVKLYFANRFNWHDREKVEESASKPVAINIVQPPSD